MEKELKNDLLYIKDRCNDTQRDLKHLKNVLYMLEEGFNSCGFDGNEFGVSVVYVLQKYLESIDTDYLQPLENKICKIGGFEQK